MVRMLSLLMISCSVKISVGDRLALERLDHVRDQQRPVALRVVGHRDDVVRVAGDVLPDGRVRALAAVPQVLLAAQRVGRADRAEDAVLVDRDHDDLVAGQRAQQVGHLGQRRIGPVRAVEDALLVGRDRAGLLEAVAPAAHAGRVGVTGGGRLERHVRGECRSPTAPWRTCRARRRPAVRPRGCWRP